MDSDEKHVADYFVISGLPEDLDASAETRPLLNPVQPITDIAVIIKGQGEQCPIGYTCIEQTPGGHSADLNHGNFKSQHLLICYRRGNDKPPLVAVGVYHEDKERVLADVEIIHTTPYGRCASTGNVGSKSGTFITYRRAKTKHPYNQLVVVDLCVILNNKSEHPPRAFYPIRKNLNKSYYGMIGSEVFLCYKKTLLSPPSLSYTPQIISRFPIQDYVNFPLPETVPLFCLPAGATIELWPPKVPHTRPSVSTFVLTSDSAQKIYGSALTFYECFEASQLSSGQIKRLRLIASELSGDDDDIDDDRLDYELYATKSICILSRWPFFDCFENFLIFLHRLVFNPKQFDQDQNQRNCIPIEHYISHFLLDVSFPTPQRPTVLVQLMPGCDETVTISQPSSALPLPMTGASYTQLLMILGVENTMSILLFGLSEQKILLHSLHPFKLTGVAEAITAMLFPFHWQCPFVPLCPLDLYGILNAPLPFIVGIDSRCFDTFMPPEDIICVDLDTKGIYLSEMKKNLNLRILPKRPARILKSSLEKIFQKLERIQALNVNQSPTFRSDANRRTIEKHIELEIQEAFLRFMVMILKGFRSYLLPITKAPTVGATDPTSLFDFEGFLSSRDRVHSHFYHLITKTQMFTHYIEERSFVSDKTSTSLAFFDDCEERFCASEDGAFDKPIKLLDTESNTGRTDRSVFIPAPEQSPSVSTSNSFAHDCPVNDHRSIRFGPLNPSLYHRHPQITSLQQLDQAFSKSSISGRRYTLKNVPQESNGCFSISRRTKQEVKSSQKFAKESRKTALDWSRCLISCCHSLWFASLPSYIAYCESYFEDDPDSSLRTISRMLRYAYSTIIRMQKLSLTPDEICFRVLTLLCGLYGQPALAVRVFFVMKKIGIEPNAVTYGYYNKAVLESKWPDHLSKPEVLWAKIKNVIKGVAQFKLNRKILMEKRKSIPKNEINLIHDECLDEVDRATSYTKTDEYFQPTTVSLSQRTEFKTPQADRSTHPRSLINRQSVTCRKYPHEKSEPVINDPESLVKSIIHKSQSMHLGRDIPDRSSLKAAKSSSLEDDEESSATNMMYAPKRTLKRRSRSALNISSSGTIQQPGEYRLSRGSFSALLEPSAGLLFTTKPVDPLLKLLSIDNYKQTNQIDKTEKVSNFGTDLLEARSFGEDTRILLKLRSEQQIQEQTSMSSNFKGCFGIRDVRAPTDRNNESTLVRYSEDIDEQEDQEDSIKLLKYVTSTPNFKLTSLINDASNLQWSKWTSSHDSKSVYKNIKSAATGILSSFQELKSSFSLSNPNTPSKPSSSSIQKSTVTRDVLQWANYFSNQASRAYDTDRDSSSLDSQELMKNSEEGSGNQSEELTDFGRCHEIFDAIEKQYYNLQPKEDPIGHISDDKDMNQNEIALEIKMTTCNRCNVCQSSLSDEEIMERWSYNESNLNTECSHCKAKMVPLMKILVEDRRFFDKSKKEIAVENLVDIESDSGADSHLSSKSSQETETETESEVPGQTFTVPYLSPIVLRKEFESVSESSGDGSASSSKFVDEHPIIFWNLLWYFSRIYAPTHLALLCLNANSILNGRQIPSRWQKTNKVVVKTICDHEESHSEVGQH